MCVCVCVRVCMYARVYVCACVCVRVFSHQSSDGVLRDAVMQLQQIFLQWTQVRGVLVQILRELHTDTDTRSAYMNQQIQRYKSALIQHGGIINTSCRFILRVTRSVIQIATTTRVMEKLGRFKI